MIFTFTFIFLIAAIPASASYTKEELRLLGVNDKNLHSYTPVDIYVGNTKLSEQARIINSQLYVPLRAFSSCVAGGVIINYDSKTRTMTAMGEGLELSATDGAYVVWANGRPLFSRTPVTILSNGRMYIPLESAVKAYGVKAESSDTLRISGSFKAITPASSFYREDEVFWLARIISAESRGESLLGQIAVGNIILNRVASRDFPNTIYSVIFDRKYGVQFTPVANGTIYNTPGYTETLAAKICLEGTRLSEDILFFMSPVHSTSFWIVNTRKYAFSIGGHDFFE